MPAPLLSRQLRSATALCGLALAAALALGGCGSDDTKPPTARPTTSAADRLVATGLDQIAGGDLASARETFASALDADPANAWAHYNLGYLAQSDADVATAIEQYEQALDTDPDLAPALYNLAILTEGADLETAVDLYRRVLEVKPDDAATHVRLGYALRHLGDKDGARTELARGFELDPTLKDAPAPAYAS